MEQNIFHLNNEIYSNNNNMLLRIIEDLQQIINTYNDNILIKRLKDIIILINKIISENKKNIELIRNDISNLYIKLNKKIDELKINCINTQEIKYNGDRDRDRYIGQVVNGVPEGKGIMYWTNGDKYEGDWKNDIKEGKGFYYYNESPYKGDRYEGDWKNHKKEGKGVYYYNNGDREMGDYSKGEIIGMHVRLTRNWEVKIENY